MITGKKGTVKEMNYGKKVGMFNGIPVAVNPTKEELERLLGTTLEREYEYYGKTDEGYKKATLSFWLKEAETGEFFNLRFYLIEKYRESQVTPGNHQYINEVGSCSWGTSESNLPDWFTKRDYRKAYVGEEELHDFIRSWVNLDYTDLSTSVLLDTQKIFNGDLREITSAIKNFSDTEVCSLATVRIAKNSQNETVEYQTVYNKKFLPGSYLKYFSQALGKQKPKLVEKFIEKVTDPQHGCNDFYILSKLENYDSAKNQLSSDKAIIQDNSADLY